MESSPTHLYLPQAFPFPIKVLSLDVAKNQQISRGTRLLSYSFVHLPQSPSSQPETRFGTWDSAIEGTIDSWNVSVGQVLSLRKAKDNPALVVIEPCKHGIQLGGLCVLCGKDMTNTDYTGFSDASRASIQMTHSAYGPTVSLEEAQRIERETAEHLIKSRKLSLIVDLDQTIVHATVDPTVGEWISEGEAWETRQAKKASTTTPSDSDDSDDTASDPDEECNPNWEALKDVKKFRLGPESFGPPSAHKVKGKQKVVENEGCMYYIKPRPGWKEFLKEMATKYEMHVYTMGTRAYAEEVCAAIDPGGSIFGGRLLSRDESGSLTQKSLQRLFPCDTSMVVIIDDRADVWEWSPNLIKVIPYDFFVGIGDINSTFLPKIEPITLSTPPKPLTGEADGSIVKINGETDSMPTGALTSKNNSSSTTEPPSAAEEEAEQTTKAMLTQNNAALEAQLEERPLAKKQEELLEGAAHAQHEGQPEDQKTPQSDEKPKDSPADPNTTTEKVVKKALLKNDDFELDRVGKLLNEVHTRFFNAYEKQSQEEKQKRKGSSSSKPYDVTRIIPRLRSEVLEGVHILFSSVIPLDTRPESTEIWRMAHMFGARCSTELTNEVTHVVAAKRGTVKVDMARKRGGTQIVWLAWFTDSVALWQRQDEKPYLLDDPPAPIPARSLLLHDADQDPDADLDLDTQQISSDPDYDLDDWEEEPIEVSTSTRTATVTRETSNALELSALDWSDINDEVEAAMNESDDDDEDDGNVGMGMRSDPISEEDWTVDAASVVSNNNTPRLKRKRLRSVTPSDPGGRGPTTRNGNGAEVEDGLRSPLAKRKKLAAERTGYSRLKEGITADDLQSQGKPKISENEETQSGTPASGEKLGSSEDGEGTGDGNGDVDIDSEEDDEEEDDFLARELEEEWG